MVRQHDTKEKILTVAKKLFAEQGFEGTSVRDIAKAAECNVASINYHFNNKEGLYLQVCELECQWIDFEINNIEAKLKESDEFSLDNLVWSMYNFFTENRRALLNSFKLVLEDSPAQDKVENVAITSSGAPGGAVLLDAIENAVGIRVDEQAKHWAKGVLFGLIIHHALLSESSYVKKRCSDIPVLRPENKRLFFDLTVKAVVNQLKSSENLPWPG